MAASQVLQHLRAAPRAWLSDYPSWWRGLNPVQKWLPVGFFIPYWIVLYLLHGLRSDHINIGVIVMALSYGGRKANVLRDFLLPLFMTGIVYDSQRFYSDYIRGRIHVVEPYWFDKTFFGIATARGVLTPNEWWQEHTYWLLDLICGFAYLVFIGVYVLICAYFRFWASRVGTNLKSAREILVRAPAMMWGFFWLNVAGYTTYYWYAAAPPWYVARYGLGPADMSAGPSQAGCVRFDQLLGTHFFSEMYGRSADVFGAIPSLHISYPLMAVFFAFRFGALRIFSICFYLLMCFSAVYLNHHYILDILWGSAYSLIISLIMDRYYLRSLKQLSL